MRSIKVLVALSASVVFFVLLAQSDADYQGWMKSVAGSKGKVTKGIAAKDAAAVTADAKTLEDVFKQVEAYWGTKNAADAVGFAKQARTAASDIGKAAAKGDFDAAATANTALGATCGGCHMAHREKGDSGFKIK